MTDPVLVALLFGFAFGCAFGTWFTLLLRDGRRLRRRDVKYWLGRPR